MPQPDVKKKLGVSLDGLLEGTRYGSGFFRFKSVREDLSKMSLEEAERAIAGLPRSMHAGPVMDRVPGLSRHCETTMTNSSCPYIPLGCQGCTLRR